MNDSHFDCLEDYQPGLPGKILYAFFLTVFRVLLRFRKVKFFYHFDKKAMTGKQVILLADHAIHNSWLYVLTGYPFARLNTVVGARHFYKKHQHFLLTHLGGIPKSLYEPDILCAKQMLTTLKRGGSLCMFPEGIECVSGSNQPINPGTVGFLKAASATVVLCKSHGLYLTNSQFGSRKHGPAELHYEILFTPEDLEKADGESVYERLLERFRYKEFDTNQKNGYAYRSGDGNANGLQNLLYICPKCHREFTMESQNDSLVCTSCKNRINVDDTFAISPDTNSILPYRNIDEWFKLQRIRVKEQIKAPDFCISYPCRLGMLSKDKIRSHPVIDRGEGEITIDATGISYCGTFNGKTEKLFFPISAVPSFIVVPGDYNELYYKKELYTFTPISSPEKVIKYMMIVEELHNLVDPKWKKVSDDAFSLPGKN